MDNKALSKLVPFLAFIILASVQHTQSQNESTTSKVGVVGKVLMLSCPGASDSDVHVKWMDLVYNNDRNPITIYERMGSGSLNEDHPHHSRYSVGDNYDLKINDLSLDDYGEYICKRRESADSTEITHTIKVNVLDTPECDGPSAVQDGAEVTLECSAEYGTYDLPNFDWYDGKAEDPLSSTDKSSYPGLYEKDLTITATRSHNSKPFFCKIGLGDVDDLYCEYIFDVHYETTDLTVTPKKDTHAVGDEIKCSANGNPPPTVVWVKDGDMELSSGVGQASFKVKEEWMGVKTTFSCSAQYSATSAALTSNVTFKATEKPPEPKTTQKPKVDEPEPSTSGGVSTAGVVGGIIAAAVILIIIIAIVYIVRKRSSKKPPGAKPVPTKDHEELVRRDPEAQKGGKVISSSLEDIMGVGPEVEKRPYSPPPSDPRYRNVEGLTYSDLAMENNNAEDVSPWKMPDRNQYANIRRP